jgi:DMSO/TMAO reductase YedYZ molybdopterin-dependent catalytic subunit
MGLFSRRDAPPPDSRLPPGQWLTRDWPVLHTGSVPDADLGAWRFSAWGELDSPAEWDYEQFQALGSRSVTADMHCVTTWSKYDNVWTGLPVRTLLDAVRPRASARFAVLHCLGGYTTNLALGDLAGEDCLFAWAHAPEPLSPEHGWPLRLVVPKLYAWKSAKWVTGLELRAGDQRGFWETRGYHNHADPWKEERYSYQE